MTLQLSFQLRGFFRLDRNDSGADDQHLFRSIAKVFWHFQGV